MNILRWMNGLPGGKSTAARVLAAAAFVGASVWLVEVWTGGSGPGLDLAGTAAASAPAERVARPPAPKAAYQVVADKDIFRSSRSAPPPSMDRAGSAPARVARRQPPNITLLGTVILDDGGAVLLRYPDSGPAAAYHRVGDVVDGFVIMEIHSDGVLLESGGEWLQVGLDKDSAVAAGGTNGSGREFDREGSDMPMDIPPGLVPRSHRSALR